MLSTNGRWIRALACIVVVLVALAWAPPMTGPSSASATSAQNQIFVAPFTGSATAGTRAAQNSQGIGGSLQTWVAQQLADKYKCASVLTSGDIAAQLDLQQKRELLGATTPEQEANFLKNIAASLGVGTFVFGTYGVVGNQYSVTVVVMDGKTGQIVDKQAASGQGTFDNTVLGLAETAVNKLQVGLCQSYWDGSITLEADTSVAAKENGTSPQSENGIGAGSVTSERHTYESVSLLPPSTLSKSSGYVDQPTATMIYQSTSDSQTREVEGYLDSCNARLRNLTFTLVETLSIEATDSWKGPVSIGLDRTSGKYTIYILAHDLLSRTTVTKKYTAFSKPPCSKPPEPFSSTTADRMSVDDWDLKGTVDPKHPYVLKGPVPPPEPINAAGVTTTFKESWSLELKNPPTSGSS